MNVAQMTTRVRTLARVNNTNDNSDSVVKTLLQMAYDRIIEEVVLNDPYRYTARVDLTLTGLFTRMPEVVEDLIEVQDVTGTEADTEGRRLEYVEASDRFSTDVFGYTLDGTSISPVGQDWEGTVLRLVYRPENDQLTSDNVSPQRIPKLHHQAIVWEAVRIIYMRDSVVPQWLEQEAYTARGRLLSGMSRNHTE